MKTISAAIVILGVAAGAAAIDEMSEQDAALKTMCQKKYVQIEHAAACQLGGSLVFAAPAVSNMQDYLVLLDQCGAIYRDSSGDFVAPVSASALRAACNSGVTWVMRKRSQESTQ